MIQTSVFTSKVRNSCWYTYTSTNKNNNIFIFLVNTNYLDNLHAPCFKCLIKLLVLGKRFVDSLQKDVNLLQIYYKWIPESITFLEGKNWHQFFFYSQQIYWSFHSHCLEVSPLRTEHTGVELTNFIKKKVDKHFPDDKKVFQKIFLFINEMFYNT